MLRGTLPTHFAQPDSVCVFFFVYMGVSVTVNPTHFAQPDFVCYSVCVYMVVSV